VTVSRRRARGALRAALLLIRIAAFVSVLPLLLRLLSLPRLLRLCGTGARPRPSDEDVVIACTDFVLRCRVWISRGSCLIRSLTLYRFLGGPAAGLAVHFGVRYAEDTARGRAGARLQGHAWLLRNGEIYLEPDRHAPRSFHVVYRHPATEQRPA
jgi:hypothetical protein